MAGNFEIYTDRAGEFRFRLLASNGQVVLTSEGYSSKSAGNEWCGVGEEELRGSVGLRPDDHRGGGSSGSI